MKVLVGGECSGRIRDAFRRRGHNAWSCDFQACESDPRWHLQQDMTPLLQDDSFDLAILHPDCDRLCNSGVRWLHERDLWPEMKAAAEFFLKCLRAKAKRVAVENSIMHRYALDIIGRRATQFVQPWWFGTPAFKATGWWLSDNLPKLVKTNPLVPPKPGTAEHKEWSRVHREPPGPNRKKNRARTDPNMAEACADQWGSL